ncbi:MAG: outer membrane beta-barrel protein [Gammaproteobacteria bacterium]|nr:outer membrane beta-barrel protein [Gammaproteobacteria bacterium]
MGKKLFIGVLALGLAPLAFANGDACYTPAPYTPGIYIGVQGGYGMSGWNGVATKKNGLAGRVFAGYDFHKHYAVEAGYTYFFNRPRGIVAQIGGNGRARIWALDLVGKIKAPVMDQFSLYAKAGVDYLHTKWKPNNTMYKGSYGNFNMVYGVGGTYQFNQNVSADLSWTRFGGRQDITSAKYAPSANLIALGVAYRFDLG